MCKKIRKTLKYSLLSIILMIIVALIFPTWTPQIKGENSISMLEQIEINGAGHEVMIRGVDRSNPILIFVHGGRDARRFLTLGSIRRSLSNTSL